MVNLPVTFFPVNTNNNTIIFEESGGGGELTATVPEGSYTITTIATAIATALTAATANAITYTVAINTSTLVMTVTASAGTFAFKWASITTGTGMAPIMGWPVGVNTITAGAQTGPDQINLAGYDFIYITSSTVTGSNNTIRSIDANDEDGRKVIMAVPINVIFSYTQLFTSPAEKFSKLPEAKSQINFKLEFEYTAGLTSAARLIDLNGREWQMQLQVEAK